MTNTPRKPITSAATLLIPTFSFRIIEERAVINIGAMKKIAEHSAIGKDTNPKKKNKFANTKRKPRNKWARGRLVLSDERPPSKGIKRKIVNKNAETDLINIIW